MRSLAVLTVVFAGCAGARFPTLPTTPEEDPHFAAPEVVISPGVDEDEPESLRLLPGDVITLQTISAEVFEYEGIIVDERGLVHLPLAGDVEVGGQPLSEAERRVEQALRAFDSVVRVNIVISAPTGHQATVLGAVTAPGRIPLLPGARLADLIAAAGGPIMAAGAQVEAPTADLDGARIIRNGRALPVSLPLAMQGDPRHNVHARAGDHLYVPPSRGRTVTVLGEVQGAAILGYYEGIRLTHALALAGGLDRDAHRSDIRVVRGSLQNPRVYQVSLRALVDGNATDVELAPGDIVFVTRTGVANMREALAAVAPILTAGQAAAFTIGIFR